MLGVAGESETHPSTKTVHCRCKLLASLTTADNLRGPRGATASAHFAGTATV